MKRNGTLLIAALALFACKQKTEVAPVAIAVRPAAAVAPAATNTALPPGHPAITQSAPPGAAPAASDAATLSGTVLDSINAAGYTYVQLKTATGDEWAAVPQTTIKKGSTVTIAVQMAMENFESKTLNRKFKRVLFGTMTGGNSAAAPAAPAMATAHQNGGMGMGMGMGTPPGMSSNAADVTDVNVPRADGGKSVAEVWAQKAALKDAPVTVRGKVVKYLPSIMGKNWIHLRDGSGSAKTADNDLVVTTNDVVKAGDVITVKGTVHLDKDFGAGYSYAVIVEDASVVR